ncbi:FGGY-family carbohydrate kinase [Paracoccus marinaquae]|uniref:FGGY-family carbohydrate kinase n=1 Tax=Paracoccus marinaquae TaxID=2841926 RepID=A0ABS6AKH5_9RHOB|nr:FGGY-family carbohydrate kinase [Paracoccus marinaquae]MBU3030731.1 FGGY-family carbohydrate kinase [Paracoccus marinaquae]
MRYLIGLDLGSGSIRAGAFDLNGRPARIASRPSTSVTPDPARPGEIVWPHRAVWATACEVLQEVIQALPADAEIAGVAAACLGMDGVPLDRDNTPLYDFIAWTDSRCVPYYEAWLRDFGEARQFLTTGSPPRGFSTLFRLQWMRDHHPEILERTRKWVLMGDFVNQRLCGELATDYSMAACTLLFSPGAAAWDQGIADKAGVDLGLMCAAKPAGTLLGQVTAAAAAETGLPQGTPVILGGHDYLCGALPVGGHRPGAVVNIGGTWDIIQATLAEFTLPEAAVGTGWTVEHHVAPGQFSAFGAAIGGGVTTWFRDTFAPGMNDDSFFALATEAAASRAALPVFLPHLAGCTGPVMDATAAGAFLGLRQSHGRTEMLAAVFEGLNLQTREILASAACLGLTPERLIMVGGSARNPGIVQSRADALGLPVDVPGVTETTAQGAAMLAGIGAGEFADMDQAVAAMTCAMTRTEPTTDGMRRHDDRLELFRTAFAALDPVNRRGAGDGGPELIEN